MKDSFTNNLNHLWKLFSRVLLQLIGKVIVVICTNATHWELEQNTWWKLPNRYCTNGSIKSFRLYCTWFINSQGLCLWLKWGNSYVFLLILKKKRAKSKNKRHPKFFPKHWSLEYLMGLSSVRSFLIYFLMTC